MNKPYYFMDKHDRLPQVGERCSPYDIVKVCLWLGWRGLAKRLGSNIDKYDDFVSDGCSMWPDEWKGKSYQKACIRHDIRYYIGGSDDDKFISDCYLAIDVCKIAGDDMARTMLIGVQGAGPFGRMMETGWRFGFGPSTGERE